MVYDNQSYWINLHEKFKGELGAVEHAFLSGTINQFKSESEVEPLLIGFKRILDSFEQMDWTKRTVSSFQGDTV